MFLGISLKRWCFIEDTNMRTYIGCIKLVVTLIKDQKQKHIPFSTMTTMAKGKIFVMSKILDLTMVLNLLLALVG
jgi:hypothetical protein